MSDEAKVIKLDTSNKPKTGELSYVVPGVLNAETIESLRERKLIRDLEHSIDLEEVALGERTVGYLTPEERTLYIETATITEELDDLSKEYSARSLEMVADAIRRTDAGKNYLKNLDQSKMFPNREAAEEYFGMVTRLEFLRSIFNNSIRERYGHAVILGVRSGFQVVEVRNKYEIPKEYLEQFGQ